jgi:hypothetical protein
MHGMAVAGGQLVLLGGERDTGVLDDVWVLRGLDGTEPYRWVLVLVLVLVLAGAACGAAGAACEAGAGVGGPVVAWAVPAACRLRAAAGGRRLPPQQALLPGRLRAPAGLGRHRNTCRRAGGGVGRERKCAPCPAPCPPTPLHTHTHAPPPPGARRWTQIKVRPSPSARFGHAVALSGSRVAAFGGCLEQSSFFSVARSYVQTRELWLLDMDSFSWTKVGRGGGGRWCQWCGVEVVCVCGGGGFRGGWKGGWQGRCWAGASLLEARPAPRKLPVQAGAGPLQSPQPGQACDAPAPAALRASPPHAVSHTSHHTRHIAHALPHPMPHPPCPPPQVDLEPGPAERMCHSLTALPSGTLMMLGGRKRDGICERPLTCTHPALPAAPRALALLGWQALSGRLHTLSWVLKCCR